jgi:hypothetical protein
MYLSIRLLGSFNFSFFIIVLCTSLLKSYTYSLLQTKFTLPILSAYLSASQLVEISKYLSHFNLFIMSRK